jgi:hypothetical protein
LLAGTSPTSVRLRRPPADRMRIDVSGNADARVRTSDPATPNLGTREDRLPPIAFFSPVPLAGGLAIRALHTPPPVSAFATFNQAYNFADDSTGVASG